MLKKIQKSNNGFTLIEMLVSVALFVIVVTIVLGSIVTIVDTNRKSQSLNLVMSNLNFAVESMVRDIKTADPKNIYTSYDFINFNDAYEVQKYYFLDGSNIVKGVVSSNETSNETSIFPDSVVVEKFHIEKIGTGQPRVFIYIKGNVAITQKTRSDFVIQTTVSPRRLKID